MTDFEKVFEATRKLDKKQFYTEIFGVYTNKNKYLTVYREKDEIEINFTFDEEGNLIDIWTTK